MRPGNQALLVLALVPFVLALPWRTRVASALALILSAGALLGLWVVHNGVLYGKYTVATGANSRLPFERAFLTDRIVRPTNGPASAKLAVLVQRDLLPEEPYRSYGIELDDFFADPSPRMIVDLTSLSNRLWGWKNDAGILRDVGIEAVRAHPGTYARGVTTTVWDLLWQPVFRNVPVDRAEAHGEPSSRVKSIGGETVVINGRRLPKPSEGERIPAPHEQAPTTPDGGNYTVWTSPSEQSRRVSQEDGRAARRGARTAYLPARGEPPPEDGKHLSQHAHEPGLQLVSAAGYLASDWSCRAVRTSPGSRARRDNACDRRLDRDSLERPRDSLRAALLRARRPGIPTPRSGGALWALNRTSRGGE